MSILEQRLSLITLGVGDLTRAKAFYTGVIGWKAIDNNPNIVFFDLGGLMLALYPHDAAAEDMKTASTELPPYRGFALAYNTRSEAEVDEVFAKLRKAGATTILKPPEKVFWGGYSGYFRDPDGHAWEVAYNPFWRIAEDGRVIPGE